MLYLARYGRTGTGARVTKLSYSILCTLNTLGYQSAQNTGTLSACQTAVLSLPHSSSPSSSPPPPSSSRRSASWELWNATTRLLHAPDRSHPVDSPWATSLAILRDPRCRTHRETHRARLSIRPPRSPLAIPSGSNLSQNCRDACPALPRRQRRIVSRLPALVYLRSIPQPPDRLHVCCGQGRCHGFGQPQLRHL